GHQPLEQVPFCRRLRGSGSVLGRRASTLPAEMPVCALYVASDSMDALQEVKALVRSYNPSLEVLGLLDSETQRRSAIGVEVANFMPSDGTALQMAAEVMFDIDLLSRARVVVGTLASQVTRVACSIGSARGTLLKAIALDFHLLDQEQRLHQQWGVRVNDVPWRPPAHSGREKRCMTMTRRSAT
ncbi:Phosphodiesterase, partial [Durusdinium trenchii]